MKNIVLHIFANSSVVIQIFRIFVVFAVVLVSVTFIILDVSNSGDSMGQVICFARLTLLVKKEKDRLRL